MKVIRLMGIDPSMANTAVVMAQYEPDTEFLNMIGFELCHTVKNGNKQIRASSDTIARCRKIDQFLQAQVQQFDPHLIIGETPTGSQSSAAMKSYGISCFALATMPNLIEVTPYEVKFAAGGKKDASKDWIVQQAVGRWPNLPWMYNPKTGELMKKNEHVADAAFAIVAAMNTMYFKHALTVMNNT